MPARLSLLSRIFLANVIVAALALVLLAFTPITVTAPVIQLAEAVMLGIGAALVLAVDLLLVRRTLAPLRRLTAVMGTIDPRQPGRRLDADEASDSEVAALTQAFNGMLDRLETERRDTAQRALRAEEDERLRIGRELHDEIGQTLTAVAIHAERAAHGPPAATAPALEQIAATIRESLGDVRRIAHELRPEALEELGLVNALISLCSRVATQSGLPVDRQLDGGLPPLNGETELVIYRVAQEALTNALRHARATRLALALTTDADNVVLTVRDDGAGMPALPLSGGRGLEGMRERALLVAGELRVASSSSGGTEIVLRVPLGTA